MAGRKDIPGRRWGVVVRGQHSRNDAAGGESLSNGQRRVAQPTENLSRSSGLWCKSTVCPGACKL